MRKVKWKNVFLLLGSGFLLGFCCYFVGQSFPRTEVGYLKADTPQVSVYDENGNEQQTLVRGRKVAYDKKDPIQKDDEPCYRATIDDKIVYIKESNLASRLEDVVLEQEVYVRTANHLMDKNLDGSILTLVEKGTKIPVTGYHLLQEDGTVDYYETNIDGQTGYFASKYTVMTEADAIKNYDEENTYQIHANRGNVYGGGSASNLDYYPVTKPKFANNVMPDEVRALYLNGSKSVMANVDEYIAFAKETNINAFVVDIKDEGAPCFQSEVMKEVSPTNYSHAFQSKEEYKNAVQKLKDAGFYVIGRITTFKDSYYAQDHPEDAILDTRSNQPYYLANSYWPSAYSRDVWKFNVDLAKEAVTDIGFNEIQFDYVRFPDRTITIEKKGWMDFRNTYNEEKAQAVQRFLMYATDELHKLNVYVSADVFGESAHTYVTAYGQYFPAISNVVDVISAMPYPDHFGTYEYGFKVPVWTVPYDIMNYWGKNYVMKRQSEIPTPAITRTWIQAYDSIKKPKVTYGSNEVMKEIQGLYDAGLTGGYMTWNSGSNLNKYKEQKAAYQKEY